MIKKSPHIGPFPELAAHLEGKRGLVTRRWLRAVRSDPTIKPAGRLTTGQLVDHLPSFYEEICSALRSDQMTLARLYSDARQHGRDRWMRGYQLDELFQELDQFQRCVQQATREFFVKTPVSHNVQAAAHQLIEDLFSATIHTAIRQLIEEQDRRISATIDERDRALAAQQKSEERLRIAASAAGLGIFEWDVPTRVGVWENKRMYEITGQPESRGPLSCQAFVRELCHPDDAQALITHYMETMQHGGDFHSVFRILRIDDRAPRVVEMNGRFRSEPDGSIRSFIGTLTDITRRTLAEESLRETDRRKDAFLATLAHELRNPLAPIRNAAQILRQISTEMPPEVEWVRVTVERQCVHLTRLIDDLMDVSRISSGKIRLQREVFDFRDAVQGAVEINLPIANEHRDRINVNMPCEPLLMNGDRTRLTQVVSNLLDNAIKYSDDDTEITIDATVHDDQVQIVVSDKGIGIPPSQLHRMFEAYVQLPSPDGRWRPGLGIGLSVVQNLVTMHGGSIVAASDGLGMGARFTVTLPTTRALATGTTDPTEPASQQMRRLRVLVIDDNRDAAESLAMILHDHEVQCAFDGEAALVVAQRFCADVVILDIGLPDISGYELARRLRKLSGTANAVLIALSGFGAPEDLARSREAGCEQHFVKPVNPATLIDFLHNRVGRRDL
ncbi:ATP-binding protein [Paraburkholderia fungorum]|uniref:hybrid sensor histidine kinase/response regulator n=1 Tax=Paraburkholderia fungorum TaxID=134537 RepID=UPI001C1EA990|nr:ATP-binding protein [Paraburkholderia fungorum]MBU7443403.1 response regulator [Paraburkholderia fungorum]